MGTSRRGRLVKQLPRARRTRDNRSPWALCHVGHEAVSGELAEDDRIDDGVAAQAVGTVDAARNLTGSVQAL